MWCLQRRTSLQGFRFRASLLFTSPCCWPTANPTDTACPCPARSVCSLLHFPRLAATAEPRGRDGIPGGLRGAAGRGAASALLVPAPALRFLVLGWACVSATTSVFAADGADSLCKLSAPSLPTLRAGRSEASSRHGHARSCGLHS